jgi:hypothetical protein
MTDSRGRCVKELTAASSAGNAKSVVLGPQILNSARDAQLERLDVWSKCTEIYLDRLSTGRKE